MQQSGKAGHKQSADQCYGQTNQINLHNFDTFFSQKPTWQNHGYTPSAAVVNGTMPAENIEYVVIYTAEDVPVIVPPVPVPTPTPTPNPEPIVNTPEVPETETPETETPETEETDDNAGYDLSVVDDEEVPLADMNDNHKCCILHFLILCLGLLIEIWYTHDQKKRQKKIFELREMLAEQTNGEIR